MNATYNTNVIRSRTWFEPTATGFTGMHHTQEFTRTGDLVRDETGPTGVEMVWDVTPVSWWKRLFWWIA